MKRILLFLCVGWSLAFCLPSEALEEPVIPIISSGTWTWNVTLTEGEDFPAKRASFPGLGETRLSWLSERDASGTHLGWNLVMGDPDENKFLDRTIAHGPQPCEFFGWQFTPVTADPIGLSRHFRFEKGTFEVLVLDFEVRETRLVRLTARCQWISKSESAR